MADDNDVRNRSYPNDRYSAPEHARSTQDPYVRDPYVSDPRNPSYSQDPVDPDNRTYSQIPRAHVQERSNVYTEQYATAGNPRSRTPEDIAYRRGYTEARNHETYHQSRLRDADRSTNIALGLLIGVLLTSIIGLIAAAFYFLNRDAEPATVQPTQTQPSPAQLQNNSNQPQTIERTVIDRRQEVVPVPGEIEVNTPNSAPQTTQPNTSTAPTSDQPTETEGSAGTETETQTGGEALNPQEGQPEGGQNQSGTTPNGIDGNSTQNDSTPGNSPQGNSTPGGTNQSGSNQGNSFVIDR
jgi:hypothetical protein